MLINEFGAVGLDHHLVDRIDDAMVLLRSGCVCCTVRGELSEAIRDLLSRRERGLLPAFDRIVIESTGLADPFPVLSTLKADPVLRHHVTPGSVVTTVDAVNGLSQLDRHPESLRQATAADHIVLTKTDLAAPAPVGTLRDRLAALNPAAMLHDAADAPGADLLFRAEGADASRGRTAGVFRAEAVDGPGEEGHLGRIRSFAIEVDGAVDWTAFGLWLTMLLNRHGDRVLRVKGIMALAGEERPVAVHGVQHLVHTPVHMSGWPTKTAAPASSSSSTVSTPP